MKQRWLLDAKIGVAVLIVAVVSAGAWRIVSPRAENAQPVQAAPLELAPQEAVPVQSVLSPEPTSGHLVEDDLVYRVPVASVPLHVQPAGQAAPPPRVVPPFPPAQSPIVSVAPAPSQPPPKPAKATSADIEIHGMVTKRSGSSGFSIDGTVTNTSDAPAPLVELWAIGSGFWVVNKPEQDAHDAAERRRDKQWDEWRERDYTGSLPDPYHPSYPKPYENRNAMCRVLEGTMRNLKPGETRPFKTVVYFPSSNVTGLQPNEIPWYLMFDPMLISHEIIVR